jgi:hypothetical protein
VSADDSDDNIIRRREFKISDSVQLRDIIIEEDVIKVAEIPEENEKDEAVGDIFDPFSQDNENLPGRIREDGTVETSPEIDIVTNLAKEGERKVNWILMASMIVIFSALGIVAGIALNPVLAIILLISLALFGFWLGELWIHKDNLHLLGVTWVIISMKVLYGLAIELQRWGIINTEILGLFLLTLVGLNVYLSYRHNSDAIAAQSTLILLVIGSATGYSFGEIGIALMILLATILVHGLAIHRKSGNLAALGIASTNLWIGMHALTSGFSIGSLTILPLEIPLLLFILIMIITGINASMAAKFARDENWFSKAFKALGLGEPGLWGVSISLGMVGALMAVGANREELGYAIGLISILISSFGGSYLVVRGVDTKRVVQPLLITGILLTILLVTNESWSMLPFDSYELFAVLGIIVTAFVMLRDQKSVTDRVLWTGSVAILILLVIMIPAESSDNLCISDCQTGDGGLLLLSALIFMHIGTAILAIKRGSPSLAGVTVILPWSWVILEEILEESIRTLIVANSGTDPGSIIHLEPTPLFGYFAIASVLMAIVNFNLGKNGVNLASQFLGLTEVSASIRDSGLLQLWSIGLWLPITTIIFMAKFGGFTALTLLGIYTLIVIIHMVSELTEKRIGNATIMLAIISSGLLILQWQYGLEEGFMAIYSIVAIALLIRNNGSNEAIYSIGMSLLAVPMLINLVARRPNQLIDTELIPNLGITKVSLLCTAILVMIYLSKAAKMEKLLSPALASLWLLTVNIALVYKEGEFYEILISLAMFVISTIWLVGNGEVRREIKSITRKNTLKELAKKESIERNTPLGMGHVTSFNPQLVELKNKRKNKREMEETENIEEIYLTDANHKPVIIILVLGLVIVSSTIISFIGGPNHLVLLSTGIFISILVLVARERTNNLELELPHFLGIEIPIAISIGGLILIQVSGHLAAGSSNLELLDMAIMVLLVMSLCIISLINQRNLLDRIPIAIDWFIVPILIGRITGTILYESLPAPFTVNPTKGDLIEWILPWTILETLLILSVIIIAWIETKKLEKKREPTTNNSLRALAIVFISTGPAGILALILAIYHTIKNQQTVEFGLAIPAILLSIVSLSNLISSLKGIADELTLILGGILLILCILTITFKKERWTMALIIDSHLLLYSGLLLTGAFTTLYLPIVLISLSTTVWIIGIIQLRRILRILGLFDLIIAILASLMILGAQMLEPITLLVSLIVLAIELGLVAWLSLSNEDEIVKD